MQLADQWTQILPPLSRPRCVQNTPNQNTNIIIKCFYPNHMCAFTLAVCSSHMCICTLKITYAMRLGNILQYMLPSMHVQILVLTLWIGLVYEVLYKCTYVYSDIMLELNSHSHLYNYSLANMKMDFCSDMMMQKCMLRLQSSWLCRWMNLCKYSYRMFLRRFGIKKNRIFCSLSVRAHTNKYWKNIPRCLYNKYSTTLDLSYINNLIYY